MITGKAEGAPRETLEGTVTKGQLVAVAPDGGGTVRFDADGDQLLMFLIGAPGAIVLTRK